MAQSRNTHEDSLEPDVPQLLRDALAEVYDGPTVLSPERQDEIVAAAMRAFHPQGRARLRFVTYRLVPFSAAAAIVFVVIVSFRLSERPAFAQLASTAACHWIFAPAIGNPILDSDPDAQARALREIEDARGRRDAALARASALLLVGNVAGAQGMLHEILEPWTDLYRREWSLGQWTAALDEIHGAIDYIDQLLSFRAHEPVVWRHICTLDLGDTLATLGRVDEARSAYHDSLEARETLYDRRARSEPERVTSYASEVGPPVYWRLRDLAISGGNFAEAKLEQARAEAALRAYFTGVCRAADTIIGDDASAFDAFWAMPVEFQRPPTRPDEAYLAPFRAAYAGWEPSPGVIRRLREHLVGEAELWLAQGNSDRAASALRQAEQVPYYFEHDEARTPVYLPLRWAYVYTSRGDFTAAYEKATEASDNLDKPNFYGRPAGILARIETKLALGVSLLGMNRSDEERARGRQFLDDALKSLGRLAAPMTPEARESFLRQFQAWNDLAKAAK